MSRYEYRVVPAPRRTPKARGKRSPEDRFAHALAETMNAMAAEGWEYLRAETLPCETRTGLFRTKTTTEQNVLVFRRATEGVVEPTVQAVRPPTPQSTVRDLRAARGMGPVVRSEPPDAPKPA